MSALQLVDRDSLFTGADPCSLRGNSEYKATCGRQSWSNYSPAIVSAKREYSPSRLETFSKLHLRIGEPAVRGRNRMCKMPDFPGHSRASWEAWPHAGTRGWGRNADRTRLRRDFLQTGNFAGKFADLAAWRRDTSRKSATIQHFMTRFPTAA